MHLPGLLVTRVRDALARWPGAAQPSGPAVAPLGRVSAAPPGLVQPDQRTCGSSCLVVARLLGDPAYAGWLAHGEVTDRPRDPRTPARRFADEVLATHARTNRWSDAAGRLQAAWPRSLGTTPWAVARELTATGGTSPAGTPHRVLTVAPSDRARAYDTVLAAVTLGHAVPLFVGNRLLPRHVVLILAGDERSLTAYDPASGRRDRLLRADFTSGTLRVSGWTEPWFAVLPTT